MHLNDFICAWKTLSFYNDAQSKGSIITKLSRKANTMGDYDTTVKLSWSSRARGELSNPSVNSVIASLFSMQVLRSRLNRRYQLNMSSDLKDK